MSQTIGRAYVTLDRHAIAKCLKRSTASAWIAGAAFVVAAYGAFLSGVDDRAINHRIAKLESRLDDHAAGDAQNVEVLWGLLASDRERLNALVVDFCRLYNYAHNGVETDDPGPD